MRTRKLPNLAAALLISLAVAACGVFQTPGPETSRLLEDLPRVANSKKLPCETQREIAAQNSYVDTIVDKTEKVYVAPAPACARPELKDSPVAGGQPKGQEKTNPGRPKADPGPQAPASTNLAPADLREQGLPPKPAKPTIDAERARRTG